MALDVSKSLHRTVRFLVGISQGFDRLFLPANLIVDGNRDFIHRFTREYLFSGATVVDIGGGKNPVVSGALKKELGLRLIGLDISDRELQAAPDGIYDETICVDATRYRGSCRADVVICSALLEHLSDTEGAFQAIRTLLKPGGMALLFVPCRNAVFARVNLMLPQGLKRRLLYIIYGDFPEVAKGMTGFPAYYNRCTPRDIRMLGRANGLRVERLEVYFASAYFQFMPPLYIVWRLWQLVFKALVGEQAAETFSVVLRKESTDGEESLGTEFRRAAARS